MTFSQALFSRFMTMFRMWKQVKKPRPESFLIFVELLFIFSTMNSE